MTALLPGIGHGLIDPIITAIGQSIPATLPEIPVPPTPDFAAATPLATIVGADPQRLLRAARSLIDDRSTITEAISTAIPIITGAATDIIGIGQRFIAQAGPLVPALLVGPAALGVLSRLAELAGEAFMAVADRLRQLEQDLAPLIARLEGLVTAALAREQLIASPATQAASAQLRELAGTAGAESAEDTEEGEGAAGGAGPVDKHDAGSAVGRAAVEAAKTQLGTPYVWGGSAPGGFDCSGLTSWAYKQAGLDIPRTAANQAVGRQVSYEELQPGDLVVWTGHVAMYAGDGQMIEAGTPVQMNPVRTNNIGMPFKGFWRPTG